MRSIIEHRACPNSSSGGKAVSCTSNGAMSAPAHLVFGNMGNGFEFFAAFGAAAICFQPAQMAATAPKAMQGATARRDYIHSSLAKLLERVSTPSIVRSHRITAGKWSKLPALPSGRVITLSEHTRTAIDKMGFKHVCTWRSALERSASIRVARGAKAPQQHPNLSTHLHYFICTS